MGGASAQQTDWPGMSLAWRQTGASVEQHSLPQVVFAVGQQKEAPLVALLTMEPSQQLPLT